MPSINSSPIEEIIKALKNDASISDVLAKDKNGIVSIRPEKVNTTSVLYPEITVCFEEKDSEIVIPSGHSDLVIRGWCEETQAQPYSFLKTLKDNILALFNRTGSQFNNIDQASNTGVNFNLFVKKSAEVDYDPVLRKYYCEVIFKVVTGEGQSYAAVDAGDKPWV